MAVDDRAGVARNEVVLELHRGELLEARPAVRTQLVGFGEVHVRSVGGEADHARRDAAALERRPHRLHAAVDHAGDPRERSVLSARCEQEDGVLVGVHV
jgi:hypothetical protein